ncbi:unnamed protein product, partial [Allacma fusca]
MTFVSIFKVKGSKSMVNLYKEKLNFNKNPVISLVCAICDQTPKYYEEFGSWADVASGKLFELAAYLNGTMELQAVFNLPEDKNLCEDGGWDDFMIPLLDGTAHISTILQLTPLHLRNIYGTNFLSQEKVIFVTGLPRKTKFNSLIRLANPFKMIAWISTLISILAIFGLLEMVIHVKSQLLQQELPKGHRCSLTFEEIL